MICPRGSLGKALAYLVAKHGIILFGLERAGFANARSWQEAGCACTSALGRQDTQEARKAFMERTLPGGTTAHGKIGKLGSAHERRSSRLLGRNYSAIRQ
jgi:hypothetical protein